MISTLLFDFAVSVVELLRYLLITILNSSTLSVSKGLKTGTNPFDFGLRHPMRPRSQIDVIYMVISGSNDFESEKVETSHAVLCTIGFFSIFFTKLTIIFATSYLCMVSLSLALVNGMVVMFFENAHLYTSIFDGDFF